MTPRLKKCVAAGSVQSLFPLLKDWPADELRALLTDSETEFCKAEAKLEEKHKELAFQPENFFSRERSKALDRGREAAEMEVLGVLAEISSVALYYLGRLKPELELRGGTGGRSDTTVG